MKRLAAFAAMMFGAMAQAPDPLSQIPRTPIPSTIQGGFTLAAAGDLIGPDRPVLGLANPQFAEVVKIFRSADRGFANQEGSIFDLAAFKGSPAAENGGGIPLGVPAVVDFGVESHAFNDVTATTGWSRNAAISVLRMEPR